MLNGQKFEVIEKRKIGNQCGIVPGNYYDNESQMMVLITSLDDWASGFGYEYHSMTDSCVVFKRVGG